MARIVPVQSIPASNYLGATSNSLSMTSGIPPGSILYLFLLYVKSLPDAVTSSQIAAFADDTKVSKRLHQSTMQNNFKGTYLI